MKKIFQYFGISLCALGISVGSVFADTQQQQCYSTLQQSISENTKFEGLYESIRDITYTDIEWTRFYKAASSFGIDLTDAQFELRYASFGEKTAYRHPPASDMPALKNTEKWDFDAKKYFIEEEYVLDESGNQIFQGCLAVYIEGEEPILAKEYGYDGERISAMSRTNFNDGTPVNILFNTSSSYKYDGTEHAKWYRVFVYPDNASTYLNRFDLVETETDNVVNDISDIYKNNPEQEALNVEYYVTDTGGNILPGSRLPEGLDQKEQEGFGEFFSRVDLYEALEEKFPVFSENVKPLGFYELDDYKSVYNILINENLSEEEKSEAYKYIDFISYNEHKRSSEETELTKLVDTAIQAGAISNVLQNEVQVLEKKAEERKVALEEKEKKEKKEEKALLKNDNKEELIKNTEDDNELIKEQEEERVEEAQGGSQGLYVAAFMLIIVLLIALLMMRKKE